MICSLGPKSGRGVRKEKPRLGFPALGSDLPKSPEFVLCEPKLRNKAALFTKNAVSPHYSPLGTFLHW